MNVVFQKTGMAVAVALTLSACGSEAPPVLTVASIAAPKNISTGGDALIRIAVPEGVDAGRITVGLNGKETAAGLKATPHGLIAKISGLAVGTNAISALYRGKEAGAVTVANYPAEGPVFSGPHQTPFVCTTDTFPLPVTGGTLGPSRDANCTADTRVDYVYRSTEGVYKPLSDPKAPPADLATTTTIDNKTVKYIVRIETGTANRAVYQFAVLHDPTVDQPIGVASPPAGWNGRLVYTYGGGYGGGFTQGDSTGGVLEDVLLARGYAVASSSLNVAQTGANDVRSAETTLMVREKFIETFGPVAYTIGWGTSGGAMQQHHIAQSYPGLLDGIIPAAASPDSVTRVGFVTDCALLDRYFRNSANKWTEAQKSAVAGFASWKTCTGGNGYAGAAWLPIGYSPGWIDPQFCVGLSTLMTMMAGDPFQKTVPESLRYDAVKNPKGARCTYQDDMANILGRDAEGRARRPLDSVGVQYGLEAFLDEKISATQFVELNEKIGGWDIDAQWIPARTVADPEALRLTYETGRFNAGGLGLADVPTIDLRTYTDPFDFHDRVRSLVTKDRMMAANGDVANRVWLLFPGESALAPVQYQGMAIDKMEQWLAAMSTDTAAGTPREKVVRNKPGDLTDACFDDKGVKIEEDMAFGVENKCNALYPPHTDPRMVAGSPLRNDVLKCQLKPVSAGDYPKALSPGHLGRLKKVFPEGVCDWSKPGVGQTGQAGVWLTYDGTGKYAVMP